MSGYYDQYDMEMVMVEEEDDDVFTEQWRRWRRPYYYGRRPWRRRYHYRPWWRRW